MIINKKFGALFEIILIIGMIFSFSYIISENNNNFGIFEFKNVKKKISVEDLLLFIGENLFGEIGIVSAGLAASDLQLGAYTCISSKNGKSCQEFFASECNEKCDGSCIPTPIDQVAECRLGTCYDNLEGSCIVNSPRSLCENKNGKWFDDPYGNIPECRKGCCTIGGKTSFVNSQECTISSARAGVDLNYRPEIDDIISCLNLGSQKEEGACVFENVDSKNNCRFTTKVECLQNNGKFASGFLCSNPDLNTICTKEAKTQCNDDGKGNSKIYWFDSCGNKENIYDSRGSWNNGKVLLESESCNLKGSGDNLANQNTCGNCIYFLGSTCGIKTDGEALSDRVQEFVCKDLSCRDESGVKRESGESWCEYQGAIGEKDGRGTDTVGSRHYRKVCIDGEVRNDPCADYRNEICVESETKIDSGKSFSTAACRINLGYTCYQLNKKKEFDKCEKNPDCFVNSVKVSKDFKFDVCVPKYKPGFSLDDRGDGSEGICGIGTQTCKYVKVKGIFSDDIINEECLTEKFSKEMNNLCMSLGDCGAQANYNGEISESYGISKEGKKLGNEYKNELRKLSDIRINKNQKPADPGADYFAKGGVPGVISAVGVPGDNVFGGTQLAGSMVGLVGILIMTTFKLGLVGGTSGPIGAVISISVAPGLSGAAGAAGGAAVGLALTGFILDATGVGKGLPTFITYSLLGAGAAGGAMLGYAAAAAYTSSLPGAQFAAYAGVYTLIIVIIVIIIFMLLGIGDVTEIDVTYTCQTWEAETGGLKCKECGSGGFPCSKYACDSLGQTCEFINEEEKGIGECIAVNADDVSPPIIRANKESLPEGYVAQDSDYGVVVKTASEDGCIQEQYNPIPFGIILNEHGQCKMSNERGKDFKDMLDLSGRNRFLLEHGIFLNIPNLRSFGIIDPFAKQDYNLYIKCQDKNGNKNDREYAINFCVKQGPDNQGPVIVDRLPVREIINFDATSVEAFVFVNEPAECKWDNLDRPYNQMINDMNCASEFSERRIQGWECKSEFPITKSEETFFVQCLDQPWLNVTSERNPSEISYKYKVRKSVEPLKIVSIVPDNKNLVYGTEPASVEVLVSTKGGYDDTAVCKFTWNDIDVDFRYGAWTSSHRQVFQTLTSGQYDIPIKCIDIVGNVASGNVKFEVELDGSAPRLSRVYVNRGELVVVTNENSVCRFERNDEDCRFKFEDGEEMSGTGTRHGTIYNDGEYFIKCKDNLGNEPGSCTVKVKKGDIII